VVTLARPLDREGLPAFSVVITATDQGFGSNTDSVCAIKLMCTHYGNIVDPSRSEQSNIKGKERMRLHVQAQPIFLIKNGKSMCMLLQFLLLFHNIHAM
jgi:Rieske Fe-S protein